MVKHNIYQKELPHRAVTVYVVIESEQRYRDNGGKSSLLYKLDGQ